MYCMGCALFFFHNKNYIVYYTVYVCVFIECIQGCLLLFYKNYIVYYNVYRGHLRVFVKKHVYATVHLNWWLYQLVTCPHSNIWPEAVYCWFTRSTMFTMSFTCKNYYFTCFVCLQLPVSEITKCIA